MGLVNDFPDGRYPSVNSVQGFGPAIRKVLDYKSIRGQFEGIRGELKGISRAVYFVEDKWQKATYLKFCVEGIRKELWKV